MTNIVRDGLDRRRRVSPFTSWFGRSMLRLFGWRLEGHAPEEVVAALVAAGVRVRAFVPQVDSLEDRFVALTGEGFDVAG